VFAREVDSLPLLWVLGRRLALVVALGGHGGSGVVVVVRREIYACDGGVVNMAQRSGRK